MFTLTKANPHLGEEFIFRVKQQNDTGLGTSHLVYSTSTTALQIT